MKKIILGLLFLVNMLYADMNWSSSYSEALQDAKEQNKILMVMISKPTCGICHYMKKQVFVEKNIIDIFNKKFIGFEIDADFEDVPEHLSYIGTPTFHFLNGNGEKIHKITGGKNAKSFADALAAIK